MYKKIILCAAMALLALSGCNSGNTNNAQPSPTPESTASPSFDEVLKTRRSIRSYDATKKISEAEVRTLLTAVQEAPSWANFQPTKYYVAISKEKLEAVQNLVGGNKERIQNAPVLIVSTFEKGKSGFFDGKALNEIGEGWGAYDNGLSNCYLIMKARAMGFDTLIMGMRESDALRQEFNIPRRRDRYGCNRPRIPFRRTQTAWTQALRRGGEILLGQQPSKCLPAQTPSRPAA